MHPTLNALISVAQQIGARPDYTQGGGGNVSLKVDDRMFVKASGLRLGELCDESHFVDINYAAVRTFHEQADPTLALPELIKAGDAAIGANILRTSGAKPSIETGFHALLGQVVLHTHSVYINTLMCSAEGQTLAQQLLPKALYIPYNTPGIALTLAIQAAKRTIGSDIILLENHGVIIVADSVPEALMAHEEVNDVVRSYFNVHEPYPTIRVSPRGDTWESASPALQTWIRKHSDAIMVFKDTILFPDQVVYGNALSFDTNAPDTVTIDRTTGTISYRSSQKEALAIEETLAAWLYIYKSVTENNLTLKTLAAAEGVFIANLDSEKYRKSVL